MRIRIPDYSLRKFLERVIFIILSLLVVILSIAAIWELRPFYGYGLDNSIVQAIGEAVSGIDGIVFQFSLSLYIWYVCTWIFLVVALCLIILSAMYLIFLSNLRSKKKHTIGKLSTSLRYVFELSILQRLSKRLVELARETSRRLEEKHALGTANEEATTTSRKWKTYAWQASLIFIVALVVFTYRYAVFPVPQGWDTAWYIYTVRSIQLDPILLATVDFGRILSVAIMYTVTSMTGLMAGQVMVLLTPIIGIIYMAGVYLLVITGTRNRLIALLAAIYTPLTFGTIRLSIDLYSNYFAWAFAMYALASYIKTMQTKETRVSYIVTTMMLFALTALAHIWTFMLLTGIILLQNLLELLKRREYKRIIKRTAIIYSPFIVVAILVPSLITASLVSLAVSYLPDQWQYASLENPYILVLAIVGIIAVMNQESTVYRRILFSWTAVTSIALMTSAFYQPYRIICLVPIAILAAHGTAVISNRIRQHLSSKSMAKPVIPLLFLLCFTATVPHTYMPEYVLRPSNEAMQQLSWIEQLYGFDNSSVIVCVDTWPPSISGVDYSNYYYWGLATVGHVLYDGLLLYLIQGIPDSHGTSFQDLAGKTIIIPDRFYGMTSIEYKASRRISDLGIYEVQFKDIAQIDQIIRNESIWLEDDFQLDQWKPNPPWIVLDYNYRVTNGSGIMNISVIPIHPDKWFDVETQLPAPIHPTSHLILKAKGNIHSLLFEVHVYSDTGLLAWIDFSKYITPENYTYLQMDLAPNMAISYVRLSLYSATVISIESYVQVDYIALI